MIFLKKVAICHLYVAITVVVELVAEVLRLQSCTTVRRRSNGRVLACRSDVLRLCDAHHLCALPRQAPILFLFLGLLPGIYLPLPEVDLICWSHLLITEMRIETA